MRWDLIFIIKFTRHCNEAGCLQHLYECNKGNKKEKKKTGLECGNNVGTYLIAVYMLENAEISGIQ